MQSRNRSLPVAALAALLVTSAPALAQIGEGPSFARMLLQTTLSLVFVALLAVVVLRVAGRAGLGRARTAKLEVLERLPVAPRQAILAVRAHDRVLLVGQSPAGLSRLGEVAAARWTAGQPGFAALLEEQNAADDGAVGDVDLDAGADVSAPPAAPREVIG